MRKNNLSGILFLVTLACSSPSDNTGTFIPDDLSRRDKTRYQQYLIQGKSLYNTHCSNCHQTDGKGMARLYPPLTKADYLLENIPRAVCIIKNGQEGTIIVNGQDYNLKMLGLPLLTNLEIAEIMTYISNSWRNETGFITVRDVNKYLEACKK